MKRTVSAWPGLRGWHPVRLASLPSGVATRELDGGPLHWTLRMACAAEFVGHGAFGIITKAAWVPYFGVVGIPPALAWKLMPLIGTVDITLGLIVGLVWPFRALLLYMAFWGLVTATIRPLSGESIWEFVERIPNWAIPLAFLCVRGFGRTGRQWWS